MGLQCPEGSGPRPSGPDRPGQGGSPRGPRGPGTCPRLPLLWLLSGQATEGSHPQCSSLVSLGCWLPRGSACPKALLTDRGLGSPEPVASSVQSPGTAHRPLSGLCSPGACLDTFLTSSLEPLIPS